MVRMKKELPFIYLVRVVACAAVVTIHTVSSNVASIGEISSLVWWIDNIIDSSVVWAVPLFVMISGALVLDSRRNGAWYAFYRKRFLKIGIPTFFWVFFYFIFFNLLHNTPLNFQVFIKQIIFEQPFINLYFLFIILELYILTPFITNITSNLDRRQGLCLSLLFLFIAIFWRPQRFVGTMFIPYIGYYILGYYLRDILISIKQQIILLMSFLVFTLLVAVGTYLFASHIVYNYGDDFFFYRHSNVLVMILTIIIYMLFKSLDHFIASHKNFYRLIKGISTKTLGIYILHWPVRVIVFYVFFHTKEIIFPIPILAQMVLFIVLFMSSGILTSIFQRLPVLRYVV